MDNLGHGFEDDHGEGAVGLDLQPALTQLAPVRFVGGAAVGTGQDVVAAVARVLPS